MPVADQLAEKDTPPYVMTRLKVVNGSKKKVFPLWEKLAETLGRNRDFQTQRRLFFCQGKSKEVTYASSRPGFINGIISKYRQFVRYVNSRNDSDTFLRG